VLLQLFTRIITSRVVVLNVVFLTHCSFHTLLLMHYSYCALLFSHVFFLTCFTYLLAHQVVFFFFFFSFFFSLFFFLSFFKFLFSLLVFFFFLFLCSCFFHKYVLPSPPCRVQVRDWILELTHERCIVFPSFFLHRSPFFWFLKFFPLILGCFLLM